MIASERSVALDKFLLKCQSFLTHAVVDLKGRGAERQKYGVARGKAVAGNARVVVGGELFPEQKNPQPVRFPELLFAVASSVEKAYSQL